MSIICTCGKASGPMCNGANGCPFNATDGMPAPKTWKERLAQEQAKQKELLAREQERQTAIDDMNEVIAIFDGWEFRKGDPSHKCPYCIGGDEPCTPAVDRFYKWGHVVFHYGLKYHSSWDALMPIVEKIEGMGYKFQICRRRVTIREDVAAHRVVLSVKGESKRMAVFNAAHQFIQLNNQAIKNEQ